jgi:hypothetical protein
MIPNEEITIVAYYCSVTARITILRDSPGRITDIVTNHITNMDAKSARDYGELLIRAADWAANFDLQLPDSWINGNCDECGTPFYGVHTNKWKLLAGGVVCGECYEADPESKSGEEDEGSK